MPVTKVSASAENQFYPEKQSVVTIAGDLVLSESEFTFASTTGFPPNANFHRVEFHDISGVLVIYLSSSFENSRRLSR